DAPPDADVWVIAPAELPRWAAADKLRPLPDPDSPSAFLPLYRTRLLTWEGRPYGAPLLGDGPLCAYRADLYADADTRKASKARHAPEWASPAAWEEFADQAAFFAERRQRPSLPPLPADDAGLDLTFHAVAAPLACRAVTGGGARVASEGRAAAFSFHY